MKRLENEMRDTVGEATEEIYAESGENTIDKGENGASLEHQAGEKSDASTVVENAPTLKISGTWTLRDTEMD